MSRQNRIIDFVGQRGSGTSHRWLVHHIGEDGHGHGYVFPAETVDWRAAEYGLTDIDEILDVIIHEPFLDETLTRDDAALRAGLVTSTLRTAEPITLFNAASTTDACAAHRLRIADVKQTRALIQPGKGPNPLDVIRARGIDTSGVRAKREVVDVRRWQLLYRDMPVPLPSSSSLLEAPRA